MCGKARRTAAASTEAVPNNKLLINVDYDLTIASQVVAPNNKPLPLINVDYDLQPFEVLMGQDQNLQKRARKDTSDEFELQ